MIGARCGQRHRRLLLLALGAAGLARLQRSARKPQPPATGRSPASHDAAVRGPEPPPGHRGAASVQPAQSSRRRRGNPCKARRSACALRPTSAPGINRIGNAPGTELTASYSPACRPAGRSRDTGRLYGQPLIPASHSGLPAPAASPRDQHRTRQPPQRHAARWRCGRAAF